MLWPEQTWPDLTWPDLTWPDLTWPDLILSKIFSIFAGCDCGGWEMAGREAGKDQGPVAVSTKVSGDTLTANTLTTDWHHSTSQGCFPSINLAVDLTGFFLYVFVNIKYHDIHIKNEFDYHLKGSGGSQERNVTLWSFYCHIFHKFYTSNIFKFLLH